MPSIYGSVKETEFSRKKLGFELHSAPPEHESEVAASINVSTLFGSVFPFRRHHKMLCLADSDGIAKRAGCPFDRYRCEKERKFINVIANHFRSVQIF